LPYIKQFQNERSSCLSYYVCCPGKGKCAIIDPGDNVGLYTEQAGRDFSDIIAIIETHIHGDHVSGARKLSKESGAPIYMERSSRVGFEFEPLIEGGKIDLGNVDLKVMLTPGHTTESISLLYVDRKRANVPWGVFTGDSLFVGDIGRLDFSGAGTREQMHDTLFGKLLSLPDYVELYPAHFVGSVCGRGMSLKTNSTIGFERRFNPALQCVSFEEFERYLTDNPLEPFPEHVQIKKMNSALEEEELPAAQTASY
jgi:hydroxyacylglutathione hydrolase